MLISSLSFPHLLDEVRWTTWGGPGDAKTLRQQVWQREKYEALFADAPPGTLRDESSALYPRDADALHRIRLAIPDVRSIALLRDPVDQREAPLPHFTDDVLLLERLTGESLAEWIDLDVDRSGGRARLRPVGRIGTAHQSSDRPIRE